MRKRFKYPLNLIGLLLTISLIFLLCYYIYYNTTNDTSIVIDNALSINYSSSNIISESNNNNISFSVSNNSDDSVEYNILFEDIITDSELTYEILENDRIVSEGIFTNSIIINNKLIEANTTHDYILNINNALNINIEGIFKIEQVVEEKIKFNDLIINNNDIKEISNTKIGSEPALTNEGLIKYTDNEETSYYFRGAVDNNYVVFADLSWRIVKINNDNSIKLVLNDEISISSYYELDTSYDFKNSVISNMLNDWYQTNLITYSDIILNHQFCNDNSLVENNMFAAYNRVILNSMATTYCLGNEVNSKIGLLTIDEVILAGASPNSSNNVYYLYNSEIDYEFYTISGARIDSNTYYPFTVGVNGEIIDTTGGNLVRSVRPVINIVNTAIVTGDGTSGDPYIINMSEGE